MKQRTLDIFCAGFGGQGIMFMGKLLAQAGLIAGKHVTWIPSYGAEVRGGTAFSMTRISDKEIASPLVINPDVLIVMNKPSLVKYEGRMKEGGLVIANRSLIDKVEKRKGVKVVNVPLTALASKLGDAKIANMIAVGILIKKSGIVSMKNALGALGVMLKGREGLLSLNKKALERGYGLSG